MAGSPVIQKQYRSRAPAARRALSFHPADEAWLRAYLKPRVTADPSMNSFAYLKMTGRKGLAYFDGQDEAILFSRHPNRDDSYVIYPPFRNEGYKDAARLGAALKTTGFQAEIIRVPAAMGVEAQKLSGGRLSHMTDLDYLFPVHVCSAQAVTQMQGQKYLNFRNRVHLAEKEGNTVDPLQPTRETLAQLRSIIHGWAPILFGDAYQEPVDYIFYALDKFLLDPSVRGLICRKDGVPNGFTLWETPHKNYDTANSLIHCTLREKGNAELLYHEMAKTLLRYDVPYFSLGGAESEGLDFFKRKMNPVRSVSLKTIIL
jgi:hypothetical protein